jgi:two-component system, NarL family, nitrate/nitrite response regulator NarL
MSVAGKALSRPPGVGPIRLLIVEDNLLGCELLEKSLTRSQLGASRFISAITYGQIVDATKNNQIDVALINEHLEDGRRNGLEVIDYLRMSSPGIRSILLAKTLTPDLVLAAFHNGAKGVFGRMEPMQALSRCIRAVYRGQVWVSSEQLEVILRALVDARPPRIATPRVVTVLTKREEEVASLVAEGLTNRDVARRLGLSEHTIGNYLFKCYEKLGLSTRVEFVLYILNRKAQEQTCSTAERSPISSNGVI